MNVSIHTYRPWDQGKRRPARLEQMQLLAFVVQAPIDVIWPATDDPLVAEALRLERQRGEPPGGKPPQRSAGASPLDVAEPAEILVRQLEKAPMGSPDQAERALSAETDLGVEQRGPADDSGGLPPWPDEFDEEPPSEQLPTDSGPVSTAHEMQARASTAQRAAADHSGATTSHAERPSSGRQVKRMVVALGAALALGGVGTVVASALSEKPVDADPSSQTVPVEAVRHGRVESRSRDVATMRTAADRGDYEAAITAARSLGDTKAIERYQRAAANVLARRADAAAGRGDLRLARQRLRNAEQRYGATSAAGDVQARIRRIQRDRTERTEQRRKAARKQAQAASGASEPAATANATTTPSSSGEASVSSGGASSDASSSSTSASSTSKTPAAESGPREKKCGDGCGLGAFPSAGQE